MRQPTNEAHERRIIHWLTRTAVALFVIALLIYPADWLAWELQKLFGDGTGSVQVSHVTIAELKGNKEEYYPDGVEAVPCSRSIFPQGGNSACWWLRRHPQVVDRY
jgi:hypothetical protein